jgi:hypothetical protein
VRGRLKFPAWSYYKVSESLGRVRRASARLLLLASLVSSPGVGFAQDASTSAGPQGDSAQSGVPWEFWPELDLYKTVNPTARFYFVVAESKGKESPLRTVDLAGYLDLTIGRHLPRTRQKEDWQTKKYVWVRIGYDEVLMAEGGTRTPPEHRGIVALHGRHYFPGGILVEVRTRADLRWLEDGYSTRYRVRIEVNRDFTVLDHVITPYVEAEDFYDTRYDGWARQLYQVGAEIGVARHFRVEPSVARQVDHLPSSSVLSVFALVARWYF